MSGGARCTEHDSRARSRTWLSRALAVFGMWTGAISIAGCASAERWQFAACATPVRGEDVASQDVDGLPLTLVSVRIGPRPRSASADPVAHARAAVSAHIANLTRSDIRGINYGNLEFMSKARLRAVDGREYQLDYRPPPPDGFKCCFWERGWSLGSGQVAAFGSDLHDPYAWCIGRDTPLVSYRHPPSGPATFIAFLPRVDSEGRGPVSLYQVSYPVEVP